LCLAADDKIYPGLPLCLAADDKMEEEEIDVALCIEHLSQGLHSCGKVGGKRGGKRGEESR
jgi:hypothetical protein